jgi:hypothetical protein
MTLRFQTTRCAKHDHPEITIQLAEGVPVPDLERTLLGFFERSVAEGARFLPGQTVQMGWALLRMLERPDGTLGVEEPSMETESGWNERVDQSLMATWTQKEIASSLGLVDRLTFPQQVQSGIVCDRLLDGEVFVLTRAEPDGEDSGWFFGCADESHDHGNPENLSAVQLISIAHRLPFTRQFLALPPGVVVVIKGPGRIRARVWLDDEAIEPGEGSYLHALNSDEGR